MDVTLLISTVSTNKKKDRTSESNNYTVLWPKKIYIMKANLFMYPVQWTILLINIIIAIAVDNNDWMDLSHQMNKIATITIFACLSLTCINFDLILLLTWYHIVDGVSVLICSYNWRGMMRYVNRLVNYSKFW